MINVKKLFEPINIGLILLLHLYILSGFGKIKNFEETSNGLKEKFEEKFPVSFNINFYKFTLCLVILLLTVGSFLLFYLHYSKQNKNLIKILCIKFILFTILATYLYHIPAVGHNFYAVLKNICIIGGFLIIYDINDK
jgi:uncharacterized membrane protein YphA (DoxX/SURF4 family)